MWQTPSSPSSLRGALATKQSRVSPRWQSGLLRGACHRAALRADPLARNDGVEGNSAPTLVSRTSCNA
ncbi:hypothetical protein EAS61_26740 [Bradyrhizobium zhanjiangense]|uniref:Uncharacterized protein n=1 Tax=Bradyrhizobium zhanjiangense TaxID=1325107 RepID=A0A4Q0QFY9_9BRAD|nr:hypothetical protein EAS61_26740 [Bradyrhizobium zhanjiangense]